MHDRDIVTVRQGVPKIKDGSKIASTISSKFHVKLSETLFDLQQYEDTINILVLNSDTDQCVCSGDINIYRKELAENLLIGY